MARSATEALAEGKDALQRSGSPTARLDAEVLLAHALGLRRVDLYVHPERPLDAEVGRKTRWNGGPRSCWRLGIAGGPPGWWTTGAGSDLVLE